MRIVLSLLFLVSSTAFAQDEETPVEPTTDAPAEADLEKARLLFQNGSTLFKEARYGDAITAWNQAYELTNKPELLFNIASAHERLGDYDKAIDVLNSYRAFATAEEKGELERRINNLDRLDREKRAAAEEAEKAAAAAAAAATPTTEVPDDSAGLSGKSAAGLALIGVGAAAVVTGAIFGASSSSNGTKALEQCVDIDGGPLCSKAAQPFLDKNKSHALISDVSIGLGIASAAVGTFLTISGSGKSVSVGANSVRFSTRF